MSARSEAVAVGERASERERRKAEAREAQALLDALEPGSDQAAKLIESAARKGIKLQVRHTLVDRAAIDSLADGLRRDYERHQAELAAERRAKLLRIGAALGVAMLVAAAVVVLSGLYVRPARAPEASLGAGTEPPSAAPPSALAAGAIGAEAQSPRAAGPGDTAPPPAHGAAKAARELCPAPSEGVPAPPPVATPAKTAEPTPPADASPKPAPTPKIEPYFGATP